MSTVPPDTAVGLPAPAAGVRRPHRLGALARGALGVAIVLAAWEYFSRSGLFSMAITPPLETIFATLASMLADGSLIHHTVATMARVFAGLAISMAIAVPLGMLMGRSQAWERVLRGPLNVLLPIPSLAWVPLVVLWFGIGNLSTVLVVVYAATFPLLLNVWTGVRTVNPIWVRAATVMNARGHRLFRHVIWPGALPYIITGVRLSFGRAWIAVIGGELLASPEWGLGKVIFDAKEYLNADQMLAALIVIGAVGLLFERVVFQYVEHVTVNRWGMAVSGRRS